MKPFGHYVSNLSHPVKKKELKDKLKRYSSCEGLNERDFYCEIEVHLMIIATASG